MDLDMSAPSGSPACWIIAFGNPQRGDDGIGLQVGQHLRRLLGHAPDVGICTLSQLDLALLEEVQTADHLIFVDACVGGDDAAVLWSVVKPHLDGWAMGSHHLEPAEFLGLLQLLYERCPTAWLVTVPGYRFDFQERLSPQARHGAEAAVAQIIDWLWVNRIVITGKSPRCAKKHKA